MILRPRLVALVQDGRKLTHRLPARPQDVEDLREPMKRGRVYAIQRAAGAKAACRVQVADILLERLGDITEQEVLAEGWPTRDAFLAAWAVERDLPSVDDLDLQQHVWVITFELFREHRPRLLASRSELGYTTDPARAMREPSGHLVGEVLDPRDHVRERWESLAGDGPTEVITRPALELSEPDRVLHRQVAGRRNREPEDVVGELRHTYPDLTPGDVRRIRRELGVRAVDGLEPLDDEAQQLALAAMFAAGGAPSVRDLCRVLDCSTTKASRLIAERNRPAAAA